MNKKVKISTLPNGGELREFSDGGKASLMFSEKGYNIEAGKESVGQPMQKEVIDTVLRFSEIADNVLDSQKGGNGINEHVQGSRFDNPPKLSKRDENFEDGHRL